MPAMSDGIVPKHVVMAILCSQDASRSCDPDAFDPAQGDYVEQYEFLVLDAAPHTGMKVRAEGESWAIAQVQPYGAVQSGDTQFTVAVCTQDGSIPTYRDDWDGEVPILYVPMTADGVLANEDGSSNFGIFFEQDEMGNILEQSDWNIESVEWFDPETNLPGGFRQVVLCWIRQESLIAA